MIQTWFQMGVRDKTFFPEPVQFFVLWFGVAPGGVATFNVPALPRSYDMKIDGVRTLFDKITKEKHMEFTRVSNLDTVNLHHASMEKKRLDLLTFWANYSDTDWGGEHLPIGSLHLRDVRIAVTPRLEPTNGFSKLTGFQIDYIHVAGAYIERHY